MQLHTCECFVWRWCSHSVFVGLLVCWDTKNRDVGDVQIISWWEVILLGHWVFEVSNYLWRDSDCRPALGQCTSYIFGFDASRIFLGVEKWESHTANCWLLSRNICLAKASCFLVGRSWFHIIVAIAQSHEINMVLIGPLAGTHWLSLSLSQNKKSKYNIVENESRKTMRVATIRKRHGLG